MCYSIFHQSTFIFIYMLFENLPFICMYSFLVCSVKPGSMSRNRGFTAQLFPWALSADPVLIPGTIRICQVVSPVYARSRHF